MNLLLCDGPANGRWADVAVVACSKGHLERTEDAVENALKAIDAHGAICSCGEDLLFTIADANYQLTRWTQDENSDEFVGIWIPNQEVTTT